MSAARPVLVQAALRLARLASSSSLRASHCAMTAALPQRPEVAPRSSARRMARARPVLPASSSSLPALHFLAPASWASRHPATHCASSSSPRASHCGAAHPSSLLVGSSSSLQASGSWPAADPSCLSWTACASAVPCPRATWVGRAAAACREMHSVAAWGLVSCCVSAARRRRRP
ncbi:hypothetical protein SPRG_19216 [Saprolegnia parasitica CBS 223.65]|uniref:Uncharacterized protein n=1 Tax=Saprolegnia parasitica (strain CBS 223.65) TaxID=695850 RepID=A0A067CWF6_SAPPC|nr:hypothetical protein SPRG_19216 [Saprolegnia parasitica CBS 223.65]KDO33585.1 hypothetical protein SPRG_19216 [Saprolegnia parasitica CBS 223.65]|eukprot:XP_012195637.1 hypothetical protein SPRG_19216 [Saprolegnia parasitica CBS 223.65]